MPVLMDRIHPYFLDPADAGSAVVLPTVDGIYVEQVLIGLADCYKQIVIRVSRTLRIPGLAKTAFPRRREKRAGQAIYSPLKSRAWFQADQIDVIGFYEHILGFVEAAMKNCLRMRLLVGMQICRLRSPLRLSIFPIATCPVADNDIPFNPRVLTPPRPRHNRRYNLSERSANLPTQAAHIGNGGSKRATPW